MRETFLTDIEIDIDSRSIRPVGYGYESSISKAKLRYEIHIEFRSWGIKQISFLVPEQVIEFPVELIKDGAENPEEFLFRVTLKQCEICLGEVRLDEEIFPRTLSLQLKDLQLVKNSYGKEFVSTAQAALAV